MTRAEGPGRAGPSSPLEIGPAAESDVRRLFGLARTVFGDRPGWSDRRVLTSLERDVIFVARELGEPAGYVALDPSEDATVVEQLFVAPGHERRGVGRHLLAHAEGYAIAAVHARLLRVVVERDNEAARRFYRRSGFVPVEEELFELVLPLPG